MKIEDTEALGRQRAKPSKIKTRYSQPTCKTNIASQMWPSGGNGGES